METTGCRSCNAPVIWTITAQGKRMPVDAEPRSDGEIELRDGPGSAPVAVYAGAATDGSARYVSHFATCKGQRLMAQTPVTSTASPVAVTLPLDGRELIRAVRRALEDDPDLTKAWPAWAQRGLAERVARHLDDALDSDEPLRRSLGAMQCFGDCWDL